MQRDRAVSDGKSIAAPRTHLSRNSASRSSLGILLTVEGAGRMLTLQSSPSCVWEPGEAHPEFT